MQTSDAVLLHEIKASLLRLETAVAERETMLTEMSEELQSIKRAIGATETYTLRQALTAIGVRSYSTYYANPGILPDPLPGRKPRFAIAAVQAMVNR